MKKTYYRTVLDGAGEALYFPRLGRILDVLEVVVQREVILDTEVELTGNWGLFQYNKIKRTTFM